MTTFEDGPAKGKTLMLKRSPRFLRVTNVGDSFDALDQLDDEPEMIETITVYEISEMRGTVHLSTRGKKGGGWFSSATYRVIEEQPTDSVLRNTSSWQEWCFSRQRESS